MPATDAAVLRIAEGYADVTALYGWLAADIGVAALPEDTRYRLHLAAEEAVMNVVKHGIPPHGPADVLVTLRCSAAAVEVLVEDAGPPFDPLAPELRRPATSLDEVVPGGWGLGLIRRTCPEPHYERRDGKNRLTLRFPLKPA